MYSSPRRVFSVVCYLTNTTGTYITLHKSASQVGLPSSHLQRAHYNDQFIFGFFSFSLIRLRLGGCCMDRQHFCQHTASLRPIMTVPPGMCWDRWPILSQGHGGLSGSFLRMQLGAWAGSESAE